jgi:hypothetical protein
MTFREIHVTQLSSPTTCYTGLKNGSFLASATHVVEINESWQQVQATPIQLPSSKFSCVGYTRTKDDQVYCILKDEEVMITTEHDEHTILSTANESVTNASRRQGTTTGTIPSNELGANLLTEESPTATEAFRAALIWHRIDQKELKLPFYSRPLTPHLSSDGLLWVGSADHCCLNCYRRTEQEIIQLDFPESTAAFLFTSPIMRLISMALTSDQQCLAIGCQDGTVSLVEYSIKAGVQHGKAHTVIVDGPIMSLDLYFTDKDELHVLVGSMCGYICRLTRISNIWHGPDLIVDNLWNGDSDDAVLAVCGMTRNRIAVGTHSGWLYVVSHSTGVLLWNCLVSYAIHSVVQNGNTLVVTTKRTLHVFEEQCAPDLLRSATLARERLECILAEQTSRKKEYDDGPTFDNESKVVSSEAPVRDKVVEQQGEPNHTIMESPLEVPTV